MFLSPVRLVLKLNHFFRSLVHLFTFWFEYRSVFKIVAKHHNAHKSGSHFLHEIASWWPTGKSWWIKQVVENNTLHHLWTICFVQYTWKAQNEEQVKVKMQVAGCVKQPLHLDFNCSFSDFVSLFCSCRNCILIRYLFEILTVAHDSGIHVLYFFYFVIRPSILATITSTSLHISTLHDPLIQISKANWHGITWLNESSLTLQPAGCHQRSSDSPLFLKSEARGKNWQVLTY